MFIKSFKSPCFEIEWKGFENLTETDWRLVWVFMKRLKDVCSESENTGLISFGFDELIELMCWEGDGFLSFLHSSAYKIAGLSVCASYPEKKKVYSFVFFEYIERKEDVVFFRPSPFLEHMVRDECTGYEVDVRNAFVSMLRG